MALSCFTGLPPANYSFTHLCKMNTIIVPHDFSSAADNASQYAAELAGKVGGQLLLVHAYQIPVTMSDFPVLIVSAEELKKNADEGLAKVKDLVVKNYPGLTVKVESRMGDVMDEIEDICNHLHPFAVVAGMKDVSGFEKFLFGNTTLSLIKKSTYPVIAVPENVKAHLPKNMVVATDLQNIQDMPVDKIIAFAKGIDARVHVVHIELEHEEKVSPEPLMAMLQSVHASYHVVKEDDVTEGIKNYTAENQIDLVLVLPHRHNFYEKLFFRGHAEGILKSMSVPVVSVH